MEINQQKEQFSNIYLQAVTTVAGYSVYKPFVDDDSVDWGVAAKGGTGPIRAPRLELQLKSTSRDIQDDTSIRYPLKLKNYDDLRMDNFAIPRILVVVLIPKTPEDWLTQSETKLCIRGCGYWISLRGMPETPNTNSVNVTIPKTNQFTVAALQSIMERISQGVQP
ncbi:DUF4365 domain-containing protein [Microcoleus sp. herbarium2]|uniref:DUF4365 domain-containing protein n=1 Tax=Microcoleus sp. herbarium2 TaxID=3055433 RepID=UPI002FD2EBBF